MNERMDDGWMIFSVKVFEDDVETIGEWYESHFMGIKK